MLTAAQFDALLVPITDLYEKYTQSVIDDIARRLVKMGVPTPTAAWQLQRLTESGLVYENALKQLSVLTGQSEKVLKETFNAAGVQALKFDDSIYKAAGLNPLPLNLSPQMLNVLQAGFTKTKGLVNNLTLTTALSGQQSFIKAADLAYMQVITGTMSYDQAIKSAVKGVADDGLSVIRFAGRTDRLDVAMRRTVLTGIGQTTGELQITRANELGSDLVEVSAHIGARPSHAEWQGKIYSLSGTHPKYPDFVESTGYGTGGGLGGWNCRHSFFPFFEDISEPSRTKKELDAYSNATVPLNGEQIPMYEATQKQRYIERQIRDWKRQSSALNSAGLDNAFEKGKVRDWQAKMRSFTGQTGLSRQYGREQI